MERQINPPMADLTQLPGDLIEMLHQINAKLGNQAGQENALVALALRKGMGGGRCSFGIGARQKNQCTS